MTTSVTHRWRAPPLKKFKPYLVQSPKPFTLRTKACVEARRAVPIFRLRLSHCTPTFDPKQTYHFPVVPSPESRPNEHRVTCQKSHVKTPTHRHASPQPPPSPITRPSAAAAVQRRRQRRRRRRRTHRRCCGCWRRRERGGAAWARVLQRRWGALLRASGERERGGVIGALSNRHARASKRRRVEEA